MASQQRLSHDEFFTSLSSLFGSTHSAAHGSVHLIQKPLSQEPSTTAEDSTSQILIRATNGLSKPHRIDKVLKQSKPKIRLSTVVEANELEAFYTRYAEVCKKGMEGLRKRDKKKAKEKAKAKKKGKAG